MLSKRDEIMDDIIKLLKLYPGESTVYFYFENEKKWIKSKSTACEINEDLINTLKSVLGENNIIVK